MAAANKPTLQEVVSDDELNYESWAPIMKATLMEKGLWDVVENRVPPNPSKIPELAATIQAKDLSRWRDFVGKDAKAIDILQCSLPDSVFRTTLEAASAKDLWDRLQESNEKAKLLKELEQLTMDTSSEFQSTIKLILLSDSYDSAVPVMDQLMAMQNLTFTGLLALLDKFESVPVETFNEYLKGLEAGSSSNCETITKMLTSLSDSYLDGVAPVMENVQTFNRIRKHLGELESIPAEVIYGCLKSLKEVGSSSQSKEDTRRNQQTPSRKVEKQNRNEVVLPEYQMLAFDTAPRTYDEDMWMIYTTTSNHMSPHEKYFTTLDRTHKARIKFITGKTIMSEGIGDVVIMTDKGKKTIKNVLFVPKIDRNVLSVGQLTQEDYGITMSVHKCTIKDEAGRLFGEAMWEEERGFLLRLQVVEVGLGVREPIRVRFGSFRFSDLQF